MEKMEDLYLCDLFFLFVIVDSHMAQHFFHSCFCALIILFNGYVILI